MRSDGSRAVLTLAIFFVLLPAGLLAFGEAPGSPSFVVTVGALCVGLILTAAVIAAIVLSRRLG